MLHFEYIINMIKSLNAPHGMGECNVGGFLLPSLLKVCMINNYHCSTVLQVFSNKIFWSQKGYLPYNSE